MMSMQVDDRLLAEARAAAARLRPVCTDFPDDRFGDLVFHAALVRLREDMDREAYEHLRDRFERDRNAFLLRLGPRDD